MYVIDIVDEYLLPRSLIRLHYSNYIYQILKAFRHLRMKGF